ncbi:jg25380 [Pararge aegeria aegeria]|uniref:Jg25380 protein n=1 Tax=Pararge aegeria aegeria TaxID=348720 RepID=A0A8S4S2S6_9NEOP|nr:jg25380 [Pararge aegeria aegeria]
MHVLPLMLQMHLVQNDERSLILASIVVLWSDARYGSEPAVPHINQSLFLAARIARCSAPSAL